MPSSSDGRRATGRSGEAAAERYLVQQGWEILAKGWRPPFAPRLGEVDILARDGSTLVVVEVRTRRGRAFGTPLESIGPKKLRRLSRLARAAAVAYDTDDVRVDAIGIEEEGGRARLTHVRGATA